MVKSIIFEVKSVIVDISSQKKDNRYNYLALGSAAGLGHIFFWLYWTYIDPQKYESIYMRIVGFISCLLLLLTPYWPKFLKKFINIYWPFVVTLNLPFLFTVNLIRNDFSEIWFAAEATMIFVVILFLTNLIYSLLAMMVGILFAVIFCFITAPESVYFDERLLLHIPIYGLTLVASYIFSYSNSKGLAVEQDIIHKRHAKTLMALAGSIAHEIRNPLGAIRMSVEGLAINYSTDLQKLQEEVKEYPRSKLETAIVDNQVEIVSHISHLKKSINLANSIIDMTLADLSGKKPDPSEYIYLDAATKVSEAVKMFGFKSEEQRKKVILDFKEGEKSFLFKGIESPFYYIIFNLVKNALYYIETEYPNSVIKVGVINNRQNPKTGKLENVVYVEDNCKGIPADKLESIFGSYYTEGKKGGTGLGLDFCKRTMVDFGGDINCESEFGKYTRFNLMFPILDEKEQKMAEEQISSPSKESEIPVVKKTRKILIVDDQPVNLMVSKKVIEKTLPNYDLEIEFAENGKVALDIVTKNQNSKRVNGNNYDIVIMDQQMPVMDGCQATINIRKINNKLPIITVTSRTSEQARMNVDFFDAYVVKPIPHLHFRRQITKWLIGHDWYNNSSNQLTAEQQRELLKGKKILFCDDEQINVVMFSNFLKKYGVEIDTASDGDELIEKFKESIKDNQPSTYDIIITDINMQRVNGTDAVRKIRRVENLNFARAEKMEENPVLIIAFSGDSDDEVIFEILKSGMDDYFIKGRNTEELIATLCYWLNLHENKFVQELNKTETENKIQNGDNIVSNYKDQPILSDSKISDIGKEDMKVFLKSFNESKAENIEKLKEYFLNKNIEQISFYTHAIKGTSGNLGLQKLYYFIKIINDYARKGSFPPEKLDEKYNNWVEELEVLLSEIEQIKID